MKSSARRSLGGLAFFAGALLLLFVVGTAAERLAPILNVVAVVAWLAAGLILVWLVLVRRQALPLGSAFRAAVARQRRKFGVVADAGEAGASPPGAAVAADAEYVVLTREKAVELGLLPALPDFRSSAGGDGSLADGSGALPSGQLLGEGAVRLSAVRSGGGQRSGESREVDR